MVQRPLHHYFANTGQAAATSSKRSFLHLPYTIRRRIYGLAGLISGKYVCLNYEPPGPGDLCRLFYNSTDLEGVPQNAEISPCSQSLSHFIDGPIPHPNIRLERRCPHVSISSSYSERRLECTALPSQLLYVSRRVSVEVESIFWSENHFAICRSDLGGLSGIQTLSERSLRWMTSLSIRLNVGGCINTWNGVLLSSCSKSCKTASRHAICEECGHEEAIRASTTPSEKSAMREWNRMCKRLTNFITPNRLKLSIICDVTDENGAREVVAPILQMPILRDCAIRFRTKGYEKSLEILAREVVFQVTRPPLTPSYSTFRFLDLPKEIQTQILEQTSLVSPFPLAWSPTKTCHRSKIFEMKPMKYRPLSNYPDTNSQSECCGMCAHSLEACCCWRKHSAYSSTCTCWQLPTTFFLTCHEIRDLATSIFFSQNSFVISPLNQRETEFISSELHQFLIQIPIDARPFLRSLRWIIEDSSHAYPKLGQRSYWDLLQVTDFCADQLDISKLRFTIDMSLPDAAHHAFGDIAGKSFNKSGFREWDAALLIAKTMARYDGWKDVFFHLSSPGILLFPGNRKRREGILEKRVMGQDYNSYSRGKVYRTCDCVVYYEDDWSQWYYLKTGRIL